MTASRLSLAVADGVVSLADAARVVALRPPADRDLSALAGAEVKIVHGFRPDYDLWAARGYAVAVEAEGRFDGAVVYCPRARRAAQALVAEALRLTDGGPVVIDGQKTDGIDSLMRRCRARGETTSAVAKSHGKLFELRAAPGDFADWAEEGLAARPGVFSAEGPDPGSERLAAALPAKLSGHVVDLGAGWGHLSAAVLERAGVTALDLVEAERAALGWAERTIPDPRARFHWADARDFAPAAAPGTVVCNPPFHAGRTADPALGAAFVAAAARMLAPAGELWLVANRHLPYERPLAAAFRETREAGGDGAFKILHARRPSSGARHAG